MRAIQNPHYAERGIGRYVAQLALGLERVAPGVVDEFILSAAGTARRPADVLAATGRLRVSSSRGPAGWESGPAVFHVMSPFEDDALSAVWPRHLRRRDAALVVTAYDLIPLIFKDHYLADMGVHRRYVERCNLLRAADIVLAISESTGDDLARLMNIPESRIRVIGGGVDEFFCRSSEPACDITARLRGALPGLEDDFILYTGGIDFRKNVEGLIKAYARVPPGLRARHQMVITCRVTDDARDGLLALATARGVEGRVFITGYVTDDALRDLYRACHLFVFPSVYEGFGLPIAEARACGAPTIAGDNSSLRELVQDPAARFDATDPGATAAVITRGLTDGPFRDHLCAAADAQDLAWDHVAEKALAAYEDAAALVASRHPRRPKIALVSPYPPQLSGIADYCHMLAVELVRAADVDLIVDGPVDAFAPAPEGCTITSLAGFDIVREYRRYDRVIYLIGNSEFHGRAIDMLRRSPGEVIAHDVRLTGVYWWRAYHGGAPPIADELARMYGPRLPHELRGVPHVSGADAQRFGIWMLRDVIENAERIWVHSEYARAIVLSEAAGHGLNCTVDVLPFGFPVPGQVGPAQLPAPSTSTRHDGPPLALPSIPDEPCPLIASFGLVGPSKNSELLINALPAIRRAAPGARMVFAGPIGKDLRVHLRALAEVAGVGDVVDFTGTLSPEEYEAWMGSADCAVQLRKTTNGESSGTVADALANGIPVVVTRLGWFAELPASAVEWVDADCSAHDLAIAVTRVLSDTNRRDEMARGGRAYAAANGFDRTARVLLDSARSL